MSFVLSDGETWVLGCVCRDAGEDGRGYDCYFTKPYTVPLSTNGDFSGQLETLMKMLGLLVRIPSQFQTSQLILNFTGDSFP